MAERRGKLWLGVGLLAAMLAVLVLVLTRDDEQARDAPSRAASSLTIGVVANAQDTNVGAELDAARELGIGSVREELRWSEVEPERGRFDDRRYDALTLAAARRGLRVLPVLFLNPVWLTSEPTALPPDLPAWRRFVKHVVGRYGAGGAFWQKHPDLDADLAMVAWEVWNEPYLSFFSGDDIDPARYGELVRATATAAHAADPAARVLAAVEIDYTRNDGRRSNWTKDLFAASPGLGSVLGGVVVHPYSQGSPLRDDGTGNRFERVADIMTLARRAGVRAPQPLWLTELGWSTCPARPPCVSPTEQGTFWREALALIQRSPLRDEVAAVYAYRLRDVGRSGPGDNQGDFGLITADGTHKPAWAQVRASALAARP